MQPFLILLGSTLLFCDPFILFRAIGVPSAVAAAGGVIGYALLLSRFLEENRQQGYSRANMIALVFLAWFSVYALGLRVMLGQDATYVSYHVFIVIGMLTGMVGAMSPFGRQTLLRAYACAALLHVLTLLPSGIRENVISGTAYGMGEVESLLRRETGFFNSPGALVLYSTGLYGIALHYVFAEKRHWIGVLLFGAATLLGGSTFNRSFSIIALLSAIFLCISLPPARRLLAVSFLLPAVILTAAATETADLYVSNLGSRFESVLSDGGGDRIYGETGVIASWDAFLESPALGSGTLVEEKDLQGLGPSGLIRPHNSVLYILVIYGGLCAMPLLFVYLGSVARSVHALLQASPESAETLHLARGVLMLSVVLLVEPLLETPTAMAVIALSMFSAPTTRIPPEKAVIA